MGGPRVSVVIPAYNEEAVIGPCVRSVADQTLPRSDYEVLLVDGRSRDRTVEIARPHVDRVVYDEGLGYTRAKNQGAREARAPIVAFTDADTVVPRRWLEAHLARFRDPRVVAAGGPTYTLENEPLRYAAWFNALSTFNNILGYVGLTHLPSPNCAYRKEALLRAGGFPDFLLTDDFSLSRSIRRFGKVRYDPALPTYTSLRRLRAMGIRWTYGKWVLGALGILVRGRPFTRTYVRLTDLPSEGVQGDPRTS
ncbi:MAG: glycosyltransferase family 2 protein [Halobacteria archaeon]